ncbi:hypothetical protein [Aliarcobacter cryaerophilus]|jgi:hypothetical protein|uniref:hypothetical protein n=1 Tax=Aliarcobacter cryaerophilus TaxID=28198 RepID=UPI00112F2461|nr:hypothetical protein [Aliarcobacter cryaerophilus]MBP6713409.1 hypothetical protein [Aliarcobacter sp.]MBP7226472.1 hypothetical protein [Aliarcobacter sp.]MBP7748901.1 hypothetical protein [Aliarcobacter sp.]
MIEIIKNILITVIVSLIVVLTNDYFNKSKIDNEIFVFSSKDLLDNKKLQIKKALLNNEDVDSKEKELELLIKTIDSLLENISKSYNKPIFQKEHIFKGNIKDLTPIVQKMLISKGLL